MKAKLWDALGKATKEVFEKEPERPAMSFLCSEFMEHEGLSQTQANRRLTTMLRAGKLRKVRILVMRNGQRQNLLGWQIVE